MSRPGRLARSVEPRRPDPQSSASGSRADAKQLSATLAAGFVGASPLCLIGASALHGPRWPQSGAPELPSWFIWAVAAAALTLVAGLARPLPPVSRRALGTAGVVAFLFQAVPVLMGSPAMTLLVLLLSAAVAVRIWSPGRTLLDLIGSRQPPGRRKTGSRTGAGAMLAASSLIAWWLVVISGSARGSLAAIALILSCLSCLVFGLFLLRPRGAAGSRARMALLAVTGLAVAGVLLTSGSGPAAWLGWLVLVPATLLVLSWLLRMQGRALLGQRAGRAAADDEVEPSLWEGLLEQPAVLLVLTFSSLGLVGMLLLLLPAAAAAGTEIGMLDAWFTAISACCVTGLIVVDTPAAFSGFGEAVILGLIQLGGLGIMVFYAALLAMLGRRMGLRQERTVAGMVSVVDRRRLYKTVANVLLLTFALEAVGAVGLTLLFGAHGDPLPTAAWRGLFTAVSAFCNAGFALQSASLIPYQQAPAVLHVVGLLVITGGLGPPVLLALPAVVRRRRVALQVKLALVVSLALLVGVAVLFAALEWERSLAALPLADKLHNAWFQSLTLRTAGFNSVEMSELSAASVTLMMVAMFIGGSPGSTAGGIKTTTVGLLLLAIGAALARRPEAVAFHRRIPHAAIYKAAAVATLGIIALLLTTLALQITQQLDPVVAIFEVFSALGTVGLSLGGTGQLDEVGKIVVSICMLAGRVGPLTLYILLVAGGRPRRWSYSEEDVPVG